MSDYRTRRDALEASIVAKNRSLPAVDVNGRPLPPHAPEPATESRPEDGPLSTSVPGGQGVHPGGPGPDRPRTVAESISAKTSQLHARMAHVRDTLDRLGR
jgi:hypothetical protein